MNPNPSDRAMVLVVEDEVLVRMVISDLLQEAGFKTIEATDPAEALALLGARSDIAVMVKDVNMPGVDGFALARHVAERWPAVEIIVSSGRVLPSPGEMPKGAAFVAKPWSSEALVRRVREAVARAEVPRVQLSMLAVEPQGPPIIIPVVDEVRPEAGIRSAEPPAAGDK
jgi:two-component system, response regulator PdtaR